MAAQLLSVLVISAAIFMGGIYAMKSLGADQEFKKIGSALEIYRLKKQNPLATGEDLKKAALRGQQQSLTQLIHESKSGKLAEEELERGLQNIGDDSTSPSTTTPVATATATANPDTALAAAEAPPQQQQQSTQVIEFDGRHGIDPLAEDQINALNVPDSVRQEILRNYQRTGVLPTLRKPSSN